MEGYKYNKETFPEDSIRVIESISTCSDVNDKFLDIITKINKDGEPVFSYHELFEIKEGLELCIPLKDIEKYIIDSEEYSIYSALQLQEIFFGLETFATDTVDIYAKLDKDGNTIFDNRQMRALRMALEDIDILIKEVYELAKLNANMRPIYNGDQMEELYLATSKISFKEAMSLIGMLNKDGKPIYDEGQMFEYRMGLESNLPLEYINIYTQLKNDVPMFYTNEMRCIRTFIEENKEKEIKQIESCINKGLKFEQLYPLLSKTSSDEIRILSSFYDMGCKVKDVRELANSGMSYEELKDVKYLLQCADACNFYPDDILDFSNKPDIEEIKNNLIDLICTEQGLHTSDSRHVIDRCLSCKMEPKYIEYLTNTDENFAYNELKPVAVALLTGFTPADINDAFDNLKVSRDEISEEELINILDDIARTKTGKMIDENDNYIDLRTFYDNDLSL